MRRINFKNLKMGINSGVIVVFSLVLVIMLNILMPLLEERFPKLKIDLTQNEVTKIGRETKELLSSLEESDKEIELIYLKGTEDIEFRVKTVLEQYDAYCDNITYREVNYHKNPTFLESYGISSEANVDGSVLVCLKDGSKVRIVEKNNMEISYNQSTVFLLENLLTNAIGVISSDKQMKVCFVTGHGEIVESAQKNPVSGQDEQGGMMLINLLKSENIALYQHDISTGAIPKEIDLVMIMAPTEDFTQSEIDRLDDYLKEGGNALIALSAGTETERLEAYMKLWGLTVNNDIVAETNTQNKFDETGIYFYGQLTGHESVSEVKNRILVSYAKSLTAENTGDISADVILTSGNGANSMKFTKDGISSENVKTGQFALGCILEKPVNGSYSDTAKMIVTSTESVWGVTRDLVTNYDAMVYYSLSEESFGNGSFVMSMLSYVFGEEIQSIYVPLKSHQVSVLSMTDAQAALMRRLLGFIMPAVIILCGVAVWLKRRNK